jgi:cGMP-dependent protein kinase
MEFIKGSELFDVIREIGLLSKQVARFYIASLILCIEYLHMKNIIYRDLKPENVMVESTGYLKLIDMGTAKRLKPSNGYRTFTIIGTPHYMAPEVMKGKGYTFAVDTWTIGVVLY